MKMSLGVGCRFARMYCSLMRRFGASGDGSNRFPSKLSRTSAGNLELIKEQGGQGRAEDELHALVLPFLYSSIDRRFCKFACNEEDHPVRRRDGCDISAFELAAFRRVFLRWTHCAGFLTSRFRFTGFV